MEKPSVTAKRLKAKWLTVQDYEIVQAERKRRLKIFREHGIEVLIKAEERLIAHGELVIKEMLKGPKKICYCGSLRVAGEAFKKAEYQSVLDGNIALLPCCMFVDIQREYGAESDYKIKADELHKRKIDMCDEVFVLNVGGYIGDSTRSEIEYATKIGKPIKYLETPPTNQTEP